MLTSLTYAALDALSRVPLRAWLVAGAIIAASIGVLVMRHDAYEAGKTDTKQEIVDANREAEVRADAASSRVTRCYGTGGTWDRTRGLCSHP